MIDLFKNINFLSFNDHQYLETLLISNAEHLKTLDLSKTQLRKVNIQNCPTLEVLNLYKAGYKKEDIPSVFDNPVFEELSLLNLKSLETIDLTLSPPKRVILKNLPSLKEISCQSWVTQINEIALVHVDSLKTLNLTGCLSIPSSREDKIKITIQDAPALEKLILPKFSQDTLVLTLPQDKKWQNPKKISPSDNSDVIEIVPSTD
jgi:hypothetical protein